MKKYIKQIQRAKEIFIEYQFKFIENFKNKERKKFIILNDTINYLNLDKFAFLLNQIIWRYINNYNWNYRKYWKIIFKGNIKEYINKIVSKIEKFLNQK